MTTLHKTPWTTLVTLSIGVGVGVSVTMWMTPPPAPAHTHAHSDTRYDEQFVKLEHAMTALTQAVQTQPTNSVCPEPTPVALPANTGESFQALAKLLRDEVRQAVVDASPEAQRAREEAIAEVEMLNSPENKAAYQSASSVVTTAVAAKRWTEDDRETFTAAVGLLTNTQRMELMDRLIPAVNRGEIEVEVMGPLF